MIAIPAIDIIDGRCVRLKQGDFDQQTTYTDDPSELALQYERSGATRIHIVDLDAARRKRDNKDIIFEIGKRTNLKIQTGGGIDSAEKVEEYLKFWKCLDFPADLVDPVPEILVISPNNLIGHF